MKDKTIIESTPGSYSEWVANIQTRNYKSILDEAFKDLWLKGTWTGYDYAEKKRGIVATKDNVVYVEFK